MSSVEENLKALGMDIPQAAAPAANYSPWVVSGTHVYISGQLPIAEGAIKYTGAVGKNISQEDATQAARLCALNILGQLNQALGNDFSRVKQLVKLGGFVQCTPDFFDQPTVINGASDLMVAALGDRGKHTRFAVGAVSLPLNAAVEIDALVEIT